jgi:hypothetical protein
LFLAVVIDLFSRIEAHIFVAFRAYCLQVTLKAKLRALAGGTTLREVIGKSKTIQIIDVKLPTTGGRELPSRSSHSPSVACCSTCCASNTPRDHHRAPPPNRSCNAHRSQPPCGEDLRHADKRNQQLGGGFGVQLSKTG